MSARPSQTVAPVAPAARRRRQLGACALGITVLLAGVGLFPQLAAGQAPDSANESAWQERQRLEASARRERELRRLRPLVHKAASGGDLTAVQSLMDEVRFSGELRQADKDGFLAPLAARRVVLVAKEARALIARGELELGRAAMQRAAVYYRALDSELKGVETPATTMLDDAQYAYFRAMGIRVRREVRGKQLERAERILEEASASLSATVFGNSKRKAASEQALHEAEGELRQAQLTETLQRARLAEQKGNLRVAHSLYESVSLESQLDETRLQASLQAKRIEDLRRSPGLDLTLSLLVPGLGQLNSGRTWPAAGFFAGTAASLTGGMLLALAADDRYEQYQAATTPEDAQELYDGISVRWNWGLVLLGTATALYIWNAVDAYASSARWNRENF